MSTDDSAGSVEIERLRAEVEHWKAHAEEAGQGFSQVCRDAARLAARNSVLVRALEAAGVPVPPETPTQAQP